MKRGIERQLEGSPLVRVVAKLSNVLDLVIDKFDSSVTVVTLDWPWLSVPQAPSAYRILPNTYARACTCLDISLGSRRKSQLCDMCAF